MTTADPLCLDAFAEVWVVESKDIDDTLQSREQATATRSLERMSNSLEEMGVPKYAQQMVGGMLPGPAALVIGTAIAVDLSKDLNLIRKWRTSELLLQMRDVSVEKIPPQVIFQLIDFIQEMLLPRLQTRMQAMQQLLASTPMELLEKRLDLYGRAVDELSTAQEALQARKHVLDQRLESLRRQEEAEGERLAQWYQEKRQRIEAERAALVIGAEETARRLEQLDSDLRTRQCRVPSGLTRCERPRIGSSLYCAEHSCMVERCDEIAIKDHCCERHAKLPAPKAPTALGAERSRGSSWGGPAPEKPPEGTFAGGCLRVVLTGIGILVAILILVSLAAPGR